MRLRPILSLALALSFSMFQSAKAATDMDVAASTQLRLLELKYFEHTFDSEPTEDRVERIEKLVRGEAGEGNPQDRIKKIAASLEAEGESLTPPPATEAANRSTGKRTAAQAPAQTANNTPAPAAGGNDTGSYPKVTNLEKEILRQTFEGQPLATRLARLETKAFGAPNNSSDLGDRTDKLEDYAENTLHDKPFAVNNDIDKPYVLSQAPPSAAGSGAQRAIEHFFNSTRRMNDEFSGRATPAAGNYSAMNFPSNFPASNAPFMNAPGANPFPGMNFTPVNSPYGGQPASQFSNASQLDDDPAAYSKDPPPANARMLTRVAWCEVQTFGHTFPNMHLTRRLRQLSDSVLPKDSKDSDLQLMDDLDPIEKAVISHKTISSGAGAGVR